jgi:hypothetical protein
MQNPSHVSLTRRLLFPYSGEEPLSLKQGLRVVLAWILVFSVPLSLFALAFMLLGRYSMQGTITLFVFAFLSGAFIFGTLGMFIVVMGNRAARIHQAWKARNGRS